ncbi:MAG: FAD:protein FMN transferase [Gammaproteobacteria bacterium]|nr:FAD:protein FMN transferase [Gammaproteobacteria bacterium]
MPLNEGSPEKSHHSRWLSLLFSIPLLVSCSLGNDARVHSHQIFAFGTVIEVSHYTDNEKLAELALQKVEEDFTYLHRAWHPYEEGPLARVNSLLETGAPFSVAPSVLPLIIKGKELSSRSEGYFNPAIGKLVQLWGFDRMEEIKDMRPPDKAVLQQWLDSRPTMEGFDLDQLTLRGKNSAVKFDFGGFAKGYGIDRVIEELRKIGVNDVIVNAGGDLRAIGSKGGKPWNIGIRHPRNKGIVASIAIQGDESVFTSGDYERFFEQEGKRYHHILNPFTGMPATDFQSVTVVNMNAAVADAAATALFVAGIEHWQRIAKNMGVEQAMLIDQQGKVIITRALRKRVQFYDVADENIQVINDE